MMTNTSKNYKVIKNLHPWLNKEIIRLQTNLNKIFKLGKPLNYRQTTKVFAVITKAKAKKIEMELTKRRLLEILGTPYEYY